MPAKTAATVALLISISATANADPLLSTDALLDYCQQSQTDQQQLCQGYIMGAVDAGDACVPASVKYSTLQDLVIVSLQQHGQSDATPASRIQKRLEEIFPCPKAEQGSAATSKPPHKSQNWSNKERIGK